MTPFPWRVRLASRPPSPNEYLWMLAAFGVVALAVLAYIAVTYWGWAI